MCKETERREFEWVSVICVCKLPTIKMQSLFPKKSILLQLCTFSGQLNIFSGVLNCICHLCDVHCRFVYSFSLLVCSSICQFCWELHSLYSLSKYKARLWLQVMFLWGRSYFLNSHLYSQTTPLFFPSFCKILALQLWDARQIPSLKTFLYCS